MSISGISSSSISSLIDSINASSTDPMRQAWKNLENALKSGDLTAAKKAYETITALHAQQVSQSGITGATSQMDSDMEALGKALESGDLTAAKSAFATVKSDMQKGPPPPSPPPSSTSSSTTDETAAILDLLNSTMSSSSSSSSKSSISSETLSQLFSLISTGKVNITA